MQKNRRDVVAIIPCRYGSTRFPGKPLASLGGQPLFTYAYESARRSGAFKRVILATDDERILSVACGRGYETIMTTSGCRTGTDRICEAVTLMNLKDEIVINIQGDEPFIPSEALGVFVEYALKKCGSVVNGISKITNPYELMSAGVVKCVVGHDLRIVYLSRSPVPYSLNKTSQSNFYKQLGLYAFSVEQLKNFAKFGCSQLETAESVEMLRLIENNVPIYGAELEFKGISVDTPGDLEDAEEILRKKNEL